jgi:hypothetical protein
MNDARRFEWDIILTLSQSLLAQARADQWDGLDILLGERQKRLESFFSREVAVEDAELIAEGINKIKSIDLEFSLLASERKQGLSTTFQEFSRSRKAARAYGEHT